MRVCFCVHALCSRNPPRRRGRRPGTHHGLAGRVDDTDHRFNPFWRSAAPRAALSSELSTSTWCRHSRFWLQSRDSPFLGIWRVSVLIGVDGTLWRNNLCYFFDSAYVNIPRKPKYNTLICQNECMIKLPHETTIHNFSATAMFANFTCMICWFRTHGYFL